MIFQLIYTCALSADFGCEDLKKVAYVSRARNLDLGVTGILLCKDGSVLQVLEGERSIVKNLYQRIIQDTRVTNPLVLIQRTSTEREFPNWSMGYRNADKDEAAAFDLTGETLANAFSKSVSPEIGTIGRTFARVNGLS